MGNGIEPIEPAGRNTSLVLDIALIFVFTLGIIAWMLAFDLIALILKEWLIYPKAGDAAIGLVIFGPIVVAISFTLLLVSYFLSISTNRLPRWFRVLTMIPPALGCLAGLAIIYRALHN